MELNSEKNSRPSCVKSAKYSPSFIWASSQDDDQIYRINGPYDTLYTAKNAKPL